MSRFGCELSHLERYADTFSVEVVAPVLPPSAVAESVSRCGVAGRRRRDLPPPLVAWLVVAAALWRGRGLRNVLAGMGRGLCRGLRWMGSTPPTSGAVTRARRRLGWKAMADLLERVTAWWHEGHGGPPPWRGLALVAVDGTTMRMPDSPENRAEFGAHRTHGRTTAFPLTRVVVLMCAVTRVVLAAAIGTSRASERALFDSLWASLRRSSLFLLDRGFFGYALLRDLVGAKHHFVIRIKKGTRLRRRRTLGSRDYLADALLPRPLRRLHPDLPERWRLRVVSYRAPGSGWVRLLTDLLDPVAYPADEIIARYRDRWEIEIGFDEIKTHLLGGEHIPLRSKSPDLIRQEIFGLLIAYDAVRMLMAQAAERIDLDPRRLSFTDAVDRVRDLQGRMASARGETLPRLFDDFLTDLATCRLPARRRRRYPRAVKAIPNYYPLRKKTRAA